ncbi:hypothetical protein AB0O14_10935 [Microbacterium foliorum]
MENESSETPVDALARLDAVSTTYADAPRGEGWYHVALGGGAGVLIASQGFPQPWASLVAVAFIITIPLFISWWRRTHGWWVSGHTGGATRWVTALMVVALAATALWSYLASELWVSLAAGAIACIAVSALGFLWMRVWRRRRRIPVQGTT